MSPWLLLGVESSLEAGVALRGGRAGERRLLRQDGGRFQHAAEPDGAQLDVHVKGRGRAKREELDRRADLVLVRPLRPAQLLGHVRDQPRPRRIEVVERKAAVPVPVPVPPRHT